MVREEHKLRYTRSCLWVRPWCINSCGWVGTNHLRTNFGTQRARAQWLNHVMDRQPIMDLQRDLERIKEDADIRLGRHTVTLEGDHYGQVNGQPAWFRDGSVLTYYDTATPTSEETS